MEVFDTSLMIVELTSFESRPPACGELYFDIWPDFLEALVEWVVSRN
jgi:hypothetical protein